MSEMVERVATAIAAAESEWDDAAKMDSGWGWENPDRGRVLYLARAAIEAMHPTDAMCDADGLYGVLNKAEARSAWHVMIAAALK